MAASHGDTSELIGNIPPVRLDHLAPGIAPKNMTKAEPRHVIPQQFENPALAVRVNQSLKAAC